VRINIKKRQRLMPYMKIGIVKQLYKDELITAEQYQFLLQKYGYKVKES